MFDLVKQNINIVRHIEKYTTLHQSGRTHHGLCPLHEDRETPSLNVYHMDNSFYCFGCHRGGSVIDFEAYRQSISPVDAAKMLCEEYNLHPTYIDSFKFQQNLQLRKKKESILESLENSLTSRLEIYNYVKSRGLSPETIKNFKLGCGLQTSVIVIPINDKFGRISGFARRNLDPNAKEKYVNDPADAIYNKSEILFNYDKAKYYMKGKKAVILNEGYFDTMSLWEAGLKHSVAFCGSRITRNQAHVLQDIIDENAAIYLVPTNDKTAQEELEKNVAQIRATFTKNHIRTLVIPDDCKDLNDVLVKYGKEKIVEIYDNSIPIELYLVKRIINTEKIVEMQYTKVKNLCNLMDNSILVDDICNYLSTAWNKSIDIVRSFVNKKDTDTVDMGKLKTMDMLMDEYDNYIETLNENRINFGWDRTDKVTRGMRIGDVVQMIASTGVGKTLWAENLILRLTKNYPDLPVMFFSLEQLGVMAFERFMMMEGNLESKDVENWGKNEDEAIKNKLIETMRTLSNNCKSFALIDEGSMTLAKVENYVVNAGIKLFNRPVKVVVIDYLGYLQGEGKDLYHKISEISKQQKELAKKLKCVIVSLHQVSKVGKSGGDPIEGYMARDSGVVMESADIMISAWRPELQENISEERKKEYEGIFVTKIVKNKYGESGIKIQFRFFKEFLKLAEKRDEPIQANKDGTFKG